MSGTFLKLVLVAPPIGHLGSGKAGGVELIMTSLIQGLLVRGHKLTLVAPEGSNLPEGCEEVETIHAFGADQPSWQHSGLNDPVVIPSQSVLPVLPYQ